MMKHSSLLSIGLLSVALTGCDGKKEPETIPAVPIGDRVSSVAQSATAPAAVVPAETAPNAAAPAKQGAPGRAAQPFNTQYPPNTYIDPTINSGMPPTGISGYGNRNGFPGEVPQQGMVCTYQPSLWDRVMGAIFSSPTPQCSLPPQQYPTYIPQPPVYQPCGTPTPCGQSVPTYPTPAPVPWQGGYGEPAYQPVPYEGTQCFIRKNEARIAVQNWVLATTLPPRTTWDSQMRVGKLNTGRAVVDGYFHGQPSKLVPCNGSPVISYAGAFIGIPKHYGACSTQYGRGGSYLACHDRGQSY